jgi:hypothetical protein
MVWIPLPARRIPVYCGQPEEECTVDEKGSYTGDLRSKVASNVEKGLMLLIILGMVIFPAVLSAFPGCAEKSKDRPRVVTGDSVILQDDSGTAAGEYNNRGTT